MTQAVIYTIATGRIVSVIDAPVESLPYFLATGQNYVLCVTGLETGLTHYVSSPSTSAAALVEKTAFSITQDVTTIIDDGVDSVTWSNVPANTRVYAPISEDYVTTASNPANDTVSFSLLYQGDYIVRFDHVEYIVEDFTISCTEVAPWA